MKKIFTNKFLIIIAVFIVALFIGCTNSFAADDTSDNTITINDVTYIMPDWFFTKEYRFFAFDKMVTSSQGKLYTTFYYNICCSDEPISFNTENNYLILNGSSLSSKNASKSLEGENSTLLDFSFAEYNEKTTTYKPYFCTKSPLENTPVTGYEYTPNPITFTTYDILNENDEVVFQQPPQVQEQATTLAPIVEEMEAKKTLAEVVGILPLIIVVVVSLVGLRKALKILLTVLNRA